MPLETSFEYDAQFRRVLERTPTGAVTTLDYDDRGRVVETIDPDGVVTETTYTADGDLLSVSVAGQIKTTSSYDANGNLLERYDADGTALSSHTFLDWGGLATWQDADGTVGSVEYDSAGAVVGLEANGQATTFGLDAFGRVVEVEDASGGRGVATFDGRGEVVAFTDANGHVQRWTYDDRGFLVGQTDKAGRQDTFTYGDEGSLLSQTSRGGDLLTFQYDVGGRLSRVDGPDGFVAYGYDPLDRLVRVENDFAVVTFAYDGDGNMVQETVTGLNPSEYPERRTHYTWSPAARLESVQLEGVGSRTWTHDDLGRPIQLQDAFTGSTSFTWNTDDLLISWERVAGSRTEFTFTPGHKLASRRTFSSAGAIVDELALERDVFGRIGAKTDALGRHEYDYDEQGQLVAADHPAASGLADESYVYDGAGNRIEWQGNDELDVVVGVADQLEQDGTYTYHYDLDGRTTDRVDNITLATTIYEWDAFDQLRRVENPDGSAVTFEYDGLGRRLVVNDRGTVTWFAYEGEEVRATFDAAGVLRSWLSTGPGGELLAEWDGATGQVRDTLPDALGSRTGWADPAGNATRTERDSFGNPVTPAGGFAPHALTWHTEDPTGLIFARSRYLDPRSGRFLTEDVVDGSNRYVYAANDPLTRWDPDGNMAVETKVLQQETGKATAGGATITGARLACLFYELASIVALIEVGVPLDIVVTGACSATGGGKGTCFPAGTVVSTLDGSVPIEDLEPGDMVLSYGGPSGAWQAVAEGVETGAWRPDDRTYAWSARTGMWTETSEPWAYDAWLDQGVLFAKANGTVVGVGAATLDELLAADDAFAAVDDHPVPQGTDWVRLIGEGRHTRLRDVPSGARLAYGGRVFEARTSESGLRLRDTGERVAWVEDRFVRRADSLLEATLRFPDGRIRSITATPDHAFYVPALQGYVELAMLQVGAELLTRDGPATVTAVRERLGSVTVYNLEIPEIHNYYVGEGIVSHNARYSKRNLRVWSDARRPNWSRRASCKANYVACTTKSALNYLPGAHPRRGRCSACYTWCDTVGNGKWPTRIWLQSPRSSCEWWRVSSR